MKAPPFGYRRVDSAAEAVAALAELGSEARVLAGGQSLLPMLAIRLASPSHLVDIGRAGDLSSASADNGSFVVGASARQWVVEHEPAATAAAPLLVDAIGRAGQVPIRHRGTVVGSIAHADPSAEIPTAFLAQGGTAVAQDTSGTRTIPAEEFFQGPYMTALRDGELLREVRLDRWPDGTGHAFEEFSHSHESWPVVTAAALVHLDQGVIDRAAIAISGVGGTPVRGTEAEASLIGQAPDPDALGAAAEAATADLQPFSDVFGSGTYRRKVATVLVRRAMSTAVARAGGAT
ncbi:MAG: FAD binding domain-containing protein [Acidimicrobiia bacterium]|nr:FAD binding domain-containing protein [Acidimicrobiia bacterium]